MPLLRNGQWVDNNPWIKIEDDAPLPEGNPSDAAVASSLERYLSLEDCMRHRVSGVWLKSEDDVLPLEAHLTHLQLVVIDFPVFTDGRGYTQARLLRTQLGFSGELRASGDIRPDQILFMARAGIDTFDFPEQPDAQLVEGILSRFTTNYQPSYALPIAG
ncbi:MAG: DUF934 domain-containing protein [Granulosicoccus sp.]